MGPDQHIATVDCREVSTSNVFAMVLPDMLLSCSVTHVQPACKCLIFKGKCEELYQAKGI